MSAPQFLRRRVVLINRRFQLKFSFFVCSWLFALSLIYPLILDSVFEQFFKRSALFPNGADFDHIKAMQKDVMISLVVLQLGFLLCTFLISLFLSHRIAGPIYKLSKFMDMAKEGQLGQKLSFRKHDHFPEVAVTFNEMIDGIRARSDNAASKIESVLATGGSVDGNARKSLEAALAELKENK
ncbi:hypothetical protein K2X30_05100 [bacterium]|jgi:methyl-accepting chemotaxis protein|nr:hypothetical protein [bacterium]